MLNPEMKKYLPLFVAGGIALIIAIYYFSSGKGSLNDNIRELEKTSTVEKVETTTNNTVVVHCKNGESYAIVFTKEQTDYQDSIYNKCSEAGGVESTQQQ